MATIKIIFCLCLLFSIAAIASGRHQSNNPDLVIPRHHFSSPPDASDIEYLQKQIDYLQSKISGLEGQISDLEDKIKRGF